MESDMFRASLDGSDLNPIDNDDMLSPVYSSSFVQLNSLGNSRNQAMLEFPLLSMLRGEMINNLPRENLGGTINAESSVSRYRQPHRDAFGDTAVSASTSIDNTSFPEHFFRGDSLSASSLANLLVKSTDLQGNPIGDRFSTVSGLPFDDGFRISDSNCSCNPSTSMNCGYDGSQGEMGRRWGFDEFLGSNELVEEQPIRTACPPYCFIGSSEPHEWSPSKSSTSVDHLYGYYASSSELSLSLSTCQPSFTNIPRARDQCSEISGSVITEHSLREVGLGSEQTSANTKELPMSCGYSTPFHFSHALSGSKYLQIVQKILAEVASYSLGNLDYQSSAWKRISVAGLDEFLYSSGEHGSGSPVKHVLQKQEVEAKKSQLLALLQAVDNRYNQCLNEIHTVISAFNNATELDPQIHTRFAFKRISLLYQTMKEKITKQILMIEESLNNGCMGDRRLMESSFIQEQWALQHLRKDHPLWRPQRGLPEKSVAVLRTWMFQNFLHPYPKDSEKHLLAIKSGLTRNQVSNWFINARVRLWKPLIEEMYLEINNRKSRRSENGEVSDCRT